MRRNKVILKNHKKGTFYKTDNANNSKPDRTPSLILQQPQIPYWTAFKTYKGDLNKQKPEEKEFLREVLKDLMAFQLRDLDYLFYIFIHQVKNDQEAIAVITERFKFIAEEYQKIYSKLLEVTAPISEDDPDSPIKVIPRLLTQVRLPYISEFPGEPIPAQLQETLEYHSKTLTAWAKNHNQNLKQTAEIDPKTTLDAEDEIFLFYPLIRPYYCTLEELYWIGPSNDYLFNQSAESLKLLLKDIESHHQQEPEILEKNISFSTNSNVNDNIHKNQSTENSVPTGSRAKEEIKINLPSLPELDADKAPYWLALNVGQNELRNIQAPLKPKTIEQALNDLYNFQLRELDYYFYVEAQKNPDNISNIITDFKNIFNKYEFDYGQLQTAVKNKTPFTTNDLLINYSTDNKELDAVINYHRQTLQTLINVYNTKLVSCPNPDQSIPLENEDPFFLFTAPYYSPDNNGLYWIGSNNVYMFKATSEKITTLINKVAKFTPTLAENLLRNLNATDLSNPFKFLPLSEKFSAVKFLPKLFNSLASSNQVANGIKHVANINVNSHHSNSDADMLKIIGALFLAALASLAYGVKKFSNSVKNIIDGKKYAKSFIRIGGILSGAAGGAFGGMIVGAIIGSAVPIIGTGLGATIGFAIGGAAMGTGLGALIGKYLGKGISYFYYKDTNPDKYQPDPSIINENDRNSITKILATIRPMKNDIGCVSSIPLTDERDTKNGYNKLIKEVQKGKIGNVAISEISEDRYNTIVTDYIQKYKADHNHVYDQQDVKSLKP